MKQRPPANMRAWGLRAAIDAVSVASGTGAPAPPVISRIFETTVVLAPAPALAAVALPSSLPSAGLHGRVYSHGIGSIPIVLEGLRSGNCGVKLCDKNDYDRQHVEARGSCFHLGSPLFSNQSLPAVVASLIPDEAQELLSGGEHSAGKRCNQLLREVNEGLWIDAYSYDAD